MLINIYRIVKTGMQGFWRNKWVSQAAVAVMVVTLFIASSLFVLNGLTNQLIGNLEQKVDITVYFNSDTPEAEIKKIQQNLNSRSEVATTSYISKHEALQNFKERHDEDSLILQSLQELEQNPLTASLNIKANDPSQFASLADFTRRNYESLIDEISFQESEGVIERVNEFTNNVKTAGLVLSIILILIVILVTYNTIRLSIYSLKDKITIMRLVGAPNWFTRGPFLTQGLLYGVVATLISTALILGVAWLWGENATQYFLGFNLLKYVRSNLMVLILAQLVLGSILGTLSSWFAVRKYLKI